MYVVVVFQSSLVIKVIPIDFIKEYNPIEMVNNAVDQSRTHIVFYSKNFNEFPDFSLDIKTEFDDGVPGCYEVRFLKFFGKNHCLILMHLNFIIYKLHWFLCYVF